MHYTEIKTYEDACKSMGITPEEDLPYANPINPKQEALNAFAMADTFTAAINDDPSFPDFNNSNQKKWEIWWDMRTTDDDPAGFGLAVAYCGSGNALSSVGERLVFNSREKAIYAANTFKEIFRKFLKK